MLRLRLERLSRGWSQSVLGVLSGLPQSSISQFERGAQTPSIDQLDRLARTLDVSPAAALLLPVTGDLGGSGHDL